VSSGMSAWSRATAGLVGRLREAPTTVPAALALALFVIGASDQAGYPVTHWAPGALIVLVLLAIAALNVPPRLREVPRPVLAALACLALFTALSYASMLWAAVPGDAWEGANRTLLYLLVFALFALWPQRGGSAMLLIVGWTLAMAALAAYVTIRVDVHSNLQWFAAEGRLSYPAGYVNAGAATWMMPLWPALLLAAERRLAWWLRGALAAAAVLLALLSLLGLSRGSLYATPVMLILVFVLLPNRLRTFAVLVPVGAGIAAVTPAVLRVGDRVENGGNAKAALHAATVQMFVAAASVGALVALAAALEGRAQPSRATVRRLRTVLAALATVCVFGVIAGGLAAAGNPVTRVRHAWDTFKSPKGYAANSTGNRLTSGFGSARYDFYRVSLDEFLAHPVLGIGADNFAEPYLRQRRSDETPHYPHSVELRTLAQTGVVGMLLGLLGLGGALLAGWRALRGPDRLAGAVAAGALAVFAYWLVHGSFDWFWEFAGLGAPAFAFLGLACALTPRAQPAAAGAPAIGSVAGSAIGSAAGSVAARRSVDISSSASVAQAGTPTASPAASERRLSPAARVGIVIGACAVVLAMVGSLAAPWFSELQIQSAARVWRADPASAYRRLRDAARLNPLSDESQLVAGSIALRRAELPAAETEFAEALQRVPGDAYATLELGAIASTRGERARALAVLRRAAELNPRDPLTQEALAIVRRGGRVDIDRLNNAILFKARRFTQKASF
jgi:O-Antigen ligase